MKQKVTLIGSGISGLSCLYFFLKKSSHKISEVEIFEKNNHIGGVLGQTQKNGFLFEHGAQGVLSSRLQFSSLVSELNLTDNISTTSQKKPSRSFFFKNKIVRISPLNVVQMLRLKLLSFFIIIRLFIGIFVRKKVADKNETVGHYFSRRFGKQFTLNFVAPVMKGIWGGGMSQILMRLAFPKMLPSRGLTAGSSKGSLDPAVKPRDDTKPWDDTLKPRDDTRPRNGKTEMLSFEKGMATLPQKLLESIQEICVKIGIPFKLHLNQHAFIENNRGLVIYSGQLWLESNDFYFLEKATVPFELNQECQQALNVLKKIPTHSLIVVGIGSSNHEIELRLDGFGALAVENNIEGVLGVISVHSLQGSHVPSDSFLYRVIMGGENIPEGINLELCSDETLIKLAKQYLQKYHLLNKNIKYKFEEVVRHVNYLPLQTAYQEQVIQAVNTLENIMPGVFFVGNYLLGPAIENCIAQAHITAQKMSEYVFPGKKQNENG